MKNIKLDLTSRKGRHCVTPTKGTCEEGYIMLIAFSRINPEFLITDVAVGERIEQWIHTPQARV